MKFTVWLFWRHQPMSTLTLIWAVVGLVFVGAEYWPRPTFIVVVCLGAMSAVVLAFRAAAAIRSWLADELGTYRSEITPRTESETR